MLIHPLQVVAEATEFWQNMFLQLRRELGNRVLQEELQLQIDLCHLPEDDPRLGEALMRIGAGARLFFSRYEIPLFWVQYPFLRQQILLDLDGFVKQFEILQNNVARVAHIPSHRWNKGEYSHDLATVVASSRALFQVVEQFDQLPASSQQLVASDLAEQVRAAHKDRIRTNRESTIVQPQMQ